MEIWWVLRGLNRDSTDSEEMWSGLKSELNSLENSETLSGADFETVDKLGSLKDSEQDKLYNEYPSAREAFNYLNERAAHPLRLDGSYLEGAKQYGQQFEQVWLSLCLLFVITKEYENAFRETELESYVLEYTEMITNEIKIVLPTSVPIFVSSYFED
jgi:hypothetical protein